VTDVELARKIYGLLRKGLGSAVDWRLCDDLGIGADALDAAVAASNGHLAFDRHRIVRVVEVPK
jgi:hypothetical protein